MTDAHRARLDALRSRLHWPGALADLLSLAEELVVEVEAKQAPLAALAAAAERLVHTWDRLGECEEEFADYDPAGTCAEWRDALDTAILALKELVTGPTGCARLDTKGADVTTFTAGQQVRTRLDAFPGSMEPEDIYARGKVGVLVGMVDDALWLWRDDAGHEAWPIESELEAIAEEQANVS
jgi:hypothetical protein